MRNVSAAPVILLALCLLSFALSCSHREEGWMTTPLPDGAVTILQHGSAEQSTAVRRAEDLILRTAFPNATGLLADQLVAAGPALRRDGTVLVVPRVREISPALWIALTNHVGRGGPVLFWGLDPASADSPATLALLRPETEFYTFTTRRLEGMFGGTFNNPGAVRMQSPFPRKDTAEEKNRHLQRWIPLAQAISPSKLVQGWPASLWVDASDSKLLRTWGWIGWDPTERAQRSQVALLQLAAARLFQRQFLMQGGFERYSFAPGDALNIPITIAAAPPSRGPWRVTAEMENEAGAVTRRLSDTIASAQPVSLVSTSLFLGTAPRRAQQEQKVTLHLTLLNATNNQLYAEIRQPVQLRAVPNATPSGSEERIGTRASLFTLDRRDVILAGADYAPLTAPFPQNGLNPHVFDPVLLKRDIALFRDAGFNVITVRYEAEEQAPQLLTLLDSLRDQHIWALLQMPALSPWNPDWASAKALLDKLQLSTNSRIFAISPESIAPPTPGAEQEPLNAGWTNWLEEQYGDLARAAEKIGLHGDIPAIHSWWDSDSRAPDAWRIAARRFLEDFAARHYDNCRAFLRAQGWSGMFTAPSGTTLDPAAGVFQLDFISLDGAALDREESERAAFYTVYARAVSDNKPVLWFNIASSMPYPPSSADLRRQALALDDSLRGIMRTYASGAIVGGFSGGPLGPNGSDRGLVNPDGAWRPSGDALRARMRDWRHAPNQPPPWRGKEVDTVNVTGGLLELWNKLSGEPNSAERSAIAEEFRPVGWNRYATETPLTGLSGTELDGPEPVQFFNATWVADSSTEPSRIARATLRQAKRLELTNTGLARWQAFREGETGSIWVTARRGDGRPVRIPILDTMPGARATISWTPTDKGIWTLRATLHPGVAFGETLRVKVE